MNLDYVPLLRVMRDIQSVPRGQPPGFNGMKRFRAYLRAIFDYDRNGSVKACKLPTLLAMNPMGKDHVTALLDAYLAKASQPWKTEAGRDILWRSRAKRTPEFLVKIMKDPATKEADQPRYFRAFDFLGGPEKDVALKSLLE